MFAVKEAREPEVDRPQPTPGSRLISIGPQFTERQRLHVGDRKFGEIVGRSAALRRSWNRWKPLLPPMRRC
jgi:hypothetical protein